MKNSPVDHKKKAIAIPKGKRTAAYYRQLRRDLAQVPTSPREALATGTKAQKKSAMNVLSITGSTDVRNANLTGVDLRDVNTTGFDMRGANLSGANLKHLNNAKLNNTNLTSTGLAGAHLAQADLSNAWMLGTDLHNAQAKGLKLTGSKQLNCDFSAIDARGSNWDNAAGAMNNLSGAQLDNMSYRGGAQVMSTMFDMSAKGAHMAGTRVDGSDLSASDFSHGVLATAGKEGVEMSAVKTDNAHVGQVAAQVLEKTSGDLEHARVINDAQVNAEVGAQVFNKTAPSAAHYSGPMNAQRYAALASFMNDDPEVKRAATPVQRVRAKVAGLNF